jgi:hypothetical protein
MACNLPSQMSIQELEQEQTPIIVPLQAPQSTQDAIISVAAF